MARAKKRNFISRMLGGRFCYTRLHNRHNNGTRETNRIIRRRLKNNLRKEIAEYEEI